VGWWQAHCTGDWRRCVTCTQEGMYTV
jgi:hypothetical protein